MKTIKIKSIVKLDYKEKVYDISVPGNNNFYIGESEILTHNCDMLLESSQALLRNVIETFALNTRFILTCNYVERIIDPIQSRCKVINILPPSKPEMAKHLVSILDKEGITYKLEDVAEIINKEYPDQRKILNLAQLSVDDKELKISKNMFTSSTTKAVLEALEKPDNLSLGKIRGIINEHNVSGFDTLYRELFENVSKYSKGRDGEVIIKIEEYMHHANSRIDKEINFCACISSILQIISKKQII